MTRLNLTTEELREALKQERLKAYARLRGGFSIPLAGATYWAALGVAGFNVDFATWTKTAFFGSGAIFPLALVYARIFNNNFMRDKSAVDSVLFPAFLSMLLFWAYIAAAAQEATSMISLILAVGMSVHWPVIGWSFGRTGIYSAHAVARAIIPTTLWFMFPEERLTWLPISVSAVYLITVGIILLDSGMVRRRLGVH